MFSLALTPSCPLSLLVLSLQTSQCNYSDHRILVKFNLTVHQSISLDFLKKKKPDKRIFIFCLLQ